MTQTEASNLLIKAEVEYLIAHGWVIEKLDNPFTNTIDTRWSLSLPEYVLSHRHQRLPQDRAVMIQKRLIHVNGYLTKKIDG